MVDNVRLHYGKAGEGPAPLLIHGLGASRQIRDGLVAEAAGGHR